MPGVVVCCGDARLLGVGEKYPRRGGEPLRGAVELGASSGGHRRTFFIGFSGLSAGALDKVVEDISARQSGLLLPRVSLKSNIQHRLGKSAPTQLSSLSMERRQGHMWS